jgi:hypothetical protein
MVISMADQVDTVDDICSKTHQMTMMGLRDEIPLFCYVKNEFWGQWDQDSYLVDPSCS